MPTLGAYDQWAGAVRSLLMTGSDDDRFAWSVNADGTVSLRRNLDGGVDLGADMMRLHEALLQADELVVRWRAEREQKERAHEEVRRVHAEAIEAIRVCLPSWVQSIEWSDDGVPSDAAGGSWRLDISKEAAEASFEEGEGGGPLGRTKQITDRIREHASISQCWWGLSGQVQITPLLGSSELADVLADVHDDVQAAITRAAASDREGRQLERSLRDEAEIAVARLRAATGEG